MQKYIGDLKPHPELKHAYEFTYVGHNIFTEYLKIVDDKIPSILHQVEKFRHDVYEFKALIYDANFYNGQKKEINSGDNNTNNNQLPIYKIAYEIITKIYDINAKLNLNKNNNNPILNLVLSNVAPMLNSKQQVEPEFEFCDKSYSYHYEEGRANKTEFATAINNAINSNIKVLNLKNKNFAKLFNATYLPVLQVEPKSTKSKKVTYKKNFKAKPTNKNNLPKKYRLSV
jgi:hypothetical protein